MIGSMNTEKAFALAQKMVNDHGLAGWRIVRRNYKSTGGVTYFGTKTIGLSATLAEKWTETQLRQIVLHEIAHALVGGDHGHDKVWSAKARSIGYTGGRTHDLPTVERRWIVSCPNHGELGRRHNRARSTRYCAKCTNPVQWTDTTKPSVNA